ncbi:MAG: MarR family transcriptional regulator [Candidatus Lokiarchaeota archaeon]|nr:MarR family transcriptional regulator [Candidatus Lokiarchaeota archaeon]
MTETVTLPKKKNYKLKVKKMFRRYGPPHSEHPRPPMPFRHKSFNEIREIFVLWLLNDQNEGITGYEFQKSYNIPRGTVLRIFDKLEKKGYIKVKENTQDARKKVYIISGQGKERLNELRKKWGERFSWMGEIVPPERFGHPFFRRNHTEHLMKDIKRLKSKEDAIDYFRGLRHRLNKNHRRLHRRMKRSSRNLTRLDTVIKFIEDMDQFDSEELKNFLSNLKSKSKKSNDTGKENPKYCKKCGAPINVQMTYCPECGAKLN